MDNYYKNLQTILMGSNELIYREYRDGNGTLTDPSSPVVRVYDPAGTRVTSAAPTKESTGVYFYQVSLDSSYSEGMYQAYWEGEIGGYLVTMDVPQYFWLQKVPWQTSVANEIISSVRRMIGDTNPNNYRILPQDMYYYLADAVNDVQSEFNMDYTVTVSPTSLTFVNQDGGSTVSSLAKNLFKIKCAELILTSVLYDVLFDGASLSLGDIKVNMKDTISGRAELRKELKREFSDLIKQVKMQQNQAGYLVDMYLYNKYGDGLKV